MTQRIKKTDSLDSHKETREFWRKLKWRVKNRWWRDPIVNLCFWCFSRGYKKMGKFFNKLQMGSYRKR